MTDLKVDNLTMIREGRQVVRSVSFQAGPGELIALIGPNGAGKTSLVRGLLGGEPREAGTATLGGAEIAQLPPAERARRLAYLPQDRPPPWPMSVREMVALGRFSYGAALGRLKGQDLRAVMQALVRCDLVALADRPATRLSGGELARVHFARAFCSEAPMLIADEPLAGLDPYHRLTLLALLKGMVEQGGCVLMILHDLSLVCQYATRVLVMVDGRLVADGPPQEVLTPPLIERVYQVKARVEAGAVHLTAPI
ncbi:putative iron(III) dicitrate ABC transporter, ATP-binding componentFecE [Parvularcula bermudensis HTCC2503]|uniref:Putative iron(III) dicitrate ABC transporter, ATP-binding componentFecE n=1 Tax=Parvularcula bermudensis (strain ATCC BAA-594 / HTCC2503 / KCTC 12087) TaxID=314260 RepID=E0TCH0_PARBH|nr:ABC transporter ATP-binding protein [Parvularcula bermudensis]ADM10326.1 putative iron(III) dicitrate ABC transporter, ATP-binding componentFecE [Parvularcula bermudensis HTCC2503]